ncbi:MAG: hypothetical protein ACKV19_16280 [Verrucomicrobiales bacterium]
MKAIPRLLLLAWLWAAGTAAAESTTHVAYVVPAGHPGNQAFNGALGMEFDVDNKIIVTKLGCFDDLSDGLNHNISVRLYDRDTLEVVASADFVPDDPGTPEREDGTLVGGSRFLPLAQPLTLPRGFHGTIVGEGYGEGERNGNSGAPTPWSLDTGNGSLQFVGTSRFNYPIVFGSYPETADAPPSARYAAGTFEFQTTAPEVPGAPVVTAVPGQGTVMVSWPAVTVPLPAVKYRISRADSPDGAFTQIAEISGTEFSDNGLTNGALYCYSVRGVGAGGELGSQSVVRCATPLDLGGANRQVAYDTPIGVPGNQAYGGSLGMDFDVINPVIVHRLGCFDDNSDGLFLPISVRIYDRDTEEVVAELLFNPDDAGTPEREDGSPIGGMRFLPLPAPVTLPLGFRGTIVADGYGDMERNANRGNPTPWTTRDGNGSLAFVGRSRFGTAGAFPGTVDGGPAAQYGAGTFIFETTAALAPGKPLARLVRASENHAASLAWDAVAQPLPAAKYQILRAEALEGPFVQIAETVELSYRDSGLPNGVEKFYQVRAVAAGGQTGPDSDVLATIPAGRSSGIAYLVPASTVGNQPFGGALGMHFEVDRPVFITRLGVFDSGSDGLFLPISARLYNRDTLQVVASLAFEPGDEGELIDGSRFKDLATPLALPAGFRGTIVAGGYGAEEQNGNTGSVDLGLTTFDGGCLRFVGPANYGLDGAGYSDIVDGGPANRYAAGTFAFVPDLPPGGLTIAPSAGGVVIHWTDLEGTLEQSPSLALGSWQLVPGALPGVEVPVVGSQQFFRLSR